MIILLSLNKKMCDHICLMDSSIFVKSEFDHNVIIEEMFFLLSAWSVGAMCAVALPLTTVSAAKWENWVRALSSIPASGYKRRFYMGSRAYLETTNSILKTGKNHTVSELEKHTVHICQIFCMALFQFVNGSQCGFSPTHKVICV